MNTTILIYLFHVCYCPILKVLFTPRLLGRQPGATNHAYAVSRLFTHWSNLDNLIERRGAGEGEGLHVRLVPTLHPLRQHLKQGRGLTGWSWTGSGSALREKKSRSGSDVRKKNLILIRLNKFILIYVSRARIRVELNRFRIRPSCKKSRFGSEAPKKKSESDPN